MLGKILGVLRPHDVQRARLVEALKAIEAETKRPGFGVIMYYGEPIEKALESVRDLLDDVPRSVALEQDEHDARHRIPASALRRLRDEAAPDGLCAWAMFELARRRL